VSTHSDHTLPGEDLREADGVAGGLADVSVVKVNGRCCECFGHELVKTGGVQIRTDCDGSFFIGGVHEGIESLGRVCPHGE